MYGEGCDILWDSFPVALIVGTVLGFLAGLGIGGGSLELKVVHSEKYEDVVTVAEYLLDHCTVVLDLNDANKEVRRRILDFLSGVAFSIGGQVRRVTENTYIITPSNVDVSESHIAAPVNEN